LFAAEIFVYDRRRARALQTTNIAFLIYSQALIPIRRRKTPLPAGAGRGVVIANIVAFFLGGGSFGRNLEA